MKREGAGGYFFIFKVVLLNESIFLLPEMTQTTIVMAHPYGV